MKKRIACPTCGSRVQGTVARYVTVDDRGRVVDAFPWEPWGSSDNRWYCERDHQLDVDIRDGIVVGVRAAVGPCPACERERAQAVEPPTLP